MSHRYPTLIALVLLLAAPLAGAETLIVPAAANADGVNNTRWRTDLQVKAFGDEPATFTLELLATGADNTAPEAVTHTVAAGTSLRIGDVLASEYGHDGTGALRLTVVDGRLAAASRTYNTSTDGTYGQAVPAVAASDAIMFGDDADLIQLSRSPDPSVGFRTNLGLVNLIGSPLRVEIDLFTAAGASLGSVARTLQPFEHRQLNDVFRMAGIHDVGDGYAVVRTTTEAGRFIAYASVVDNGSGDAVFLLARADGDTDPSAARRLVVFEALMRPG